MGSNQTLEIPLITFLLIAVAVLTIALLANARVTGQQSLRIDELVRHHHVNADNNRSSHIFFSEQLKALNEILQTTISRLADAEAVAQRAHNQAHSNERDIRGLSGQVDYYHRQHNDGVTGARAQVNHLTGRLDELRRDVGKDLSTLVQQIESGLNGLAGAVGVEYEPPKVEVTETPGAWVKKAANDAPKKVGRPRKAA